jgi:regulator of protease activity HflC (stomatin/prohibitin superfamily)
MSESTARPNRKVVAVALGGFIVQLATFVLLLVVSFWANGTSAWARADAIFAAAMLTAPGVPIWFALFLVYKQLARVRDEELETVELTRARQSGEDTALFEVGDEDLLIERNRLKWIIRWMLPSLAVVLSLAIVLFHFLGWRWSLEAAFRPVTEGGVALADRPALMIWFAVGAGFLAFLFAWYTLALAKIREWQLLHAGASSLIGTALACLLVACALFLSQSVDSTWAEPLVAYILRVLLLVMALEYAVNFVLDFYRPRARDHIARPPVDSRLLGLIGQPGSLAKSIADAVNYQFGFEVSSTWFYRLLQRWLLPLVFVTLVIVLLMTSVVIVDAHERAIIERFGTPWKEPRVLDAGVHFKLPYPIDITRRIPVHSVQEIVIGEATDHTDDQRAILWTKQHEYIPEMMLLVASSDARRLAGGAERAPDATERVTSEGVSVSLVMVSVPVEYRIVDAYAFLAGYADPTEVLESVVYQTLSDYASRIDLNELVGPGRARINAELTARVQRRVEELNLGVEIVMLGLRGAHPPAKNDVAATFQSVVSAEIEMSAVINAAQGEYQKALTTAAGSVERAIAIDRAVRRKDSLETAPDTDPRLLDEARRELDTLLMGDDARRIEPVSGKAAALIEDARAYANDLVSDVASKARAFQAEVIAYLTAPELYRRRKMLEKFEELDHVRKYLITGDPSNVVVIYDTGEEVPLDTILRDRGSPSAGGG